MKTKLIFSCLFLMSINNVYSSIEYLKRNNEKIAITLAIINFFLFPDKNLKNLIKESSTNMTEINNEFYFRYYIRDTNTIRFYDFLIARNHSVTNYFNSTKYLFFTLISKIFASIATYEIVKNLLN